MDTKLRFLKMKLFVNSCTKGNDTHRKSLEKLQFKNCYENDKVSAIFN